MALENNICGPAVNPNQSSWGLLHTTISELHFPFSSPFYINVFSYAFGSYCRAFLWDKKKKDWMVEIRMRERMNLELSCSGHESSLVRDELQRPSTFFHHSENRLLNEKTHCPHTIIFFFSSFNIQLYKTMGSTVTFSCTLSFPFDMVSIKLLI